MDSSYDLLNNLFQEASVKLLSSFSEIKFKSIRLIQQPSAYVDAFKSYYGFISQPIETELRKLDAMRADYIAGRDGMAYLICLLTRSNIDSTFREADMRLKLDKTKHSTVSGIVNVLKDEVTNLFTSKKTAATENDTVDFQEEFHYAIVNNTANYLNGICKELGNISRTFPALTDETHSVLMKNIGLAHELIDQCDFFESGLLSCRFTMLKFISIVDVVSKNMSELSNFYKCDIDFLKSLLGKVCRLLVHCNKKAKSKDKELVKALKSLETNVTMLLSLKKFYESENCKKFVKQYVDSRADLKTKFGSQLNVETSIKARGSRTSTKKSFLQSDAMAKIDLMDSKSNIMKSIKSIESDKSFNQLNKPSTKYLQHYLDNKCDIGIDDSVLLKISEHLYYVNGLREANKTLQYLDIDNLINKEEMALIRRVHNSIQNAGSDKSIAQLERIFNAMQRRRGFERHFEKDEFAEYSDCKRLLDQLKLAKEEHPKRVNYSMKVLENMYKRLGSFHSAAASKAARYSKMDSELEGVNPKTFEEFQQIIQNRKNDKGTPNFNLAKENLLAIYSECLGAKESATQKVKYDLFNEIHLSQRDGGFNATKFLIPINCDVVERSETLKNNVQNAVSDLKVHMPAVSQRLSFSTPNSKWYNLCLQRLQMIQVGSDYSNCMAAYGNLNNRLERRLKSTLKFLSPAQKAEFQAKISSKGLDKPITSETSHHPARQIFEEDEALSEPMYISISKIPQNNVSMSSMKAPSKSTENIFDFDGGALDENIFGGNQNEDKDASDFKVNEDRLKLCDLDY